MDKILKLVLTLLLFGIVFLPASLSAQELRPTKNMHLIESVPDTDLEYYVIFLTGNGGWRNLAQAVTAYLNAKDVSVVAVNTKKYMWKEKEPAQIACDLEALIDRYNGKWGKSQVVLLGYSMGAEDLPFAVNCMKDSYLHFLKDIILIGPWQKATFKINLLDYVMELNKGLDIYAELQRMKMKTAYVICDDNEMSICHKDLESVIDHDFLGGGHHFGGDYNMLSKMIGRRLNLE
jgi:type IV secretory pathway VirJ component